ncbi:MULTISPECIES: hypothetical protein [Alistipes]|uniref:hypothetical protein n=2 Tax=Rikenellaceae TaxID=171550 RepID=UPI0023F53B80|nr:MULTISPECIES: hypothetical protein [Alistipes]MDY4931243.1 hypothetical protein [Alistipes shahii]
MKRIVLSVFCVFRRYDLSPLRNTNKHKRHTNVISIIFSFAPTRKFSLAYTLYMLEKVRVRLIGISKSSFGNEIVTSVRHWIDKIRNENGLIKSKPSCGHGLRKENRNSEVADLFGGAIYPHDLMEIAASMQGLGVGRCLDGSQAFGDLFVESIAWMLNVRINKS